MRRRLRRRPAARKALTSKSTIWKAPGSSTRGLTCSSAWDARFRLDSARKAVFVLVPTGNPPSLRFGHPDVTFGRYRLSALRYCAGAAAFSGYPLSAPLPERAGAPSESDIRVPSRVLSAAKQGEAEHPRGWVPLQERRKVRTDRFPRPGRNEDEYRFPRATAHLVQNKRGAASHLGRQRLFR